MQVGFAFRIDARWGGSRPQVCLLQDEAVELPSISPLSTTAAKPFTCPVRYDRSTAAEGAGDGATADDDEDEEELVRKAAERNPGAPHDVTPHDALLACIVAAISPRAHWRVIS